MLYSERKRMADISAREGSGEDLWTDDVPVEARRKIAFHWQRVLNIGSSSMRDRFWQLLEVQFRADGHASWATSTSDFVQVSEPDDILNHLEAAWRALAVLKWDVDGAFQAAVNEVFNQHRVAFRMVDGEIVPLASDELHVEVIVPTLRLLTDSRFEKAHAAYLKALKEISADDAGDAITDAGTALQEALKALGCDGNALGPLLKDAKKKGLLTRHDQRLVDGISKFIEWASADRSTTGDAHSHGDAANADAWLMVHVVGALILRLADPTKRGEAG